MAKKAIIIVDDEAIILYSLKNELETSFGNEFIYEPAIKADEALEIVEGLETEGISVSLIITDQIMPGMKGDELIAAAQKSYPHIKGLLITGLTERSSAQIQHNTQTEVLLKPWDAAHLIKLVRNLTG